MQQAMVLKEQTVQRNSIVLAFRSTLKVFQLWLNIQILQYELGKMIDFSVLEITKITSSCCIIDIWVLRVKHVVYADEVYDQFPLKAINKFHNSCYSSARSSKYKHGYGQLGICSISLTSSLYIQALRVCFRYGRLASLKKGRFLYSLTGLLGSRLLWAGIKNASSRSSH